MSPEQELQEAALKAREILPQMLIECDQVARDLKNREFMIKAMQSIVCAAELMVARSKKETT